MAIANFNHGRQWALIALQEVLGTELEAAIAIDAVKLPVDAIVVGGSLIITEAFDAAVTLDLTGAGVTLSAPADATIVGRTDLVLDGSTNTTGAPVQVTGSGVSVAGAAYVEVQYIRTGRANEVQV